jgi:hypothetical protein
MDARDQIRDMLDDLEAAYWRCAIALALVTASTVGLIMAGEPLIAFVVWPWAVPALLLKMHEKNRRGGLLRVLDFRVEHDVCGVMEKAKHRGDTARANTLFVEHATLIYHTGHTSMCSYT